MWRAVTQADEPVSDGMVVECEECESEFSVNLIVVDE